MTPPGFVPMKNSVAAIVIALGCATSAWSAAPPALTSLRAIRTLSNADAAKELPVAFEATVTYFNGYQHTLFVQDGEQAVFVWCATDAELLSGDHVLIRGTIEPSFRAIVRSDSITRLSHGAIPKPVPATFDELNHSEYDSMLVSTRGVVRSADRAGSRASPLRYIILKVLTDGGYIDVEVDGGDDRTIEDLLDTEIEATGVAGAKFDGKMERTGVVVHVSKLADIQILKRPNASPWSLPVSPMEDALAAYHVQDLTQRLHVQGTVTYYQPGSSVVLQSGTKSMWIATLSHNPLSIGNQADATGFPFIRSGFLILNRGEFQQSPVYAPVTPQPATWEELASSKHLFNLVSIEGQVVTAIREASQDEYVLVSDGHMFSAIYRHPDIEGKNSLSPMKEVPIGSRVRVIGICSLEDSNPYIGQVPFNILMRKPDDIAVVAQPSMLNVRNLVLVIVLLLIIVLGVGSRAWFIEHRVRRQTSALAYLERRRGKILEDINGSRPLAEIVEEITELVSFKLKGAPCWCQISGGAQLGNRPKNLTGMRIVRQDLPARSGLPLGELFTAFDSASKPRNLEPEALSMATSLAALAIETRRLYSDLLRRSEFDLLTDIHNRFSLDKSLDAQIEQGRQNASIFGLIYIDLDHFKQVNDLYGHHIGDLYLQEVSLRMKRQLRGHDVLARLGGDEFAVLVTVVHSRADVQEIARRLERCFDEPYPVEDLILYPAASVGVAVYPEDATTKDGLLNTADAAMYKAKNAKRQIAEILTSLQNS
jgi:diguanylate cyclase (GGDEF)-like protein